VSAEHEACGARGATSLAVAVQSSALGVICTCRSCLVKCIILPLCDVDKILARLSLKHSVLLPPCAGMKYPK
jgi:hypothetical protein